jgi:hypothetical protein
MPPLSQPEQSINVSAPGVLSDSVPCRRRPLCAQHVRNQPLRYTDPSGRAQECAHGDEGGGCGRGARPGEILASIYDSRMMDYYLWSYLRSHPKYDPASDLSLTEDAGRFIVANAQFQVRNGAVRDSDKAPIDRKSLAETIGFLFLAGSVDLPGPSEGRVPTSREPRTTIDPLTGYEVGRFIGDANGNIMIEPVGGSTVAGRNPVDTHTLYPNGSNYQRLNPQGHGQNTTPHGHGHLPGAGPGKAGQGPSLSVDGRIVRFDTVDAHWPLR